MECIVFELNCGGPVVVLLDMWSACSAVMRRYVHELLKYEFEFEFDIPATYPVTAPEICIPELDGKTAKMYRGGCYRAPSLHPGSKVWFGTPSSFTD